jgi:hypothetical protein
MRALKGLGFTDKQIKKEKISTEVTNDTLKRRFLSELAKC